MLSFNDNEEEKKKMREELEQYLKEFKEKKDEEGNPLIVYPSNFEVISLAMGRKDLNSNDKNQWSKYLFGSKFDSDIESLKFEDGRYKKLMNEIQKENEFQKGMAEIELLDKQLGKLNKRVNEIKIETAEMELNSDNNNVDSTFMTRLITPGGNRSINSSQQSSPISTARSNRSNSNQSKRNIKSSNSQTKSKSQSDSDEDDNEDNNDLDVEKENPEITESGQDEENERTYTEEEVALELRLKLLLEDDTESNEAWTTIVKYGYTDEQQKRIDEIDDKLAQFELERKQHLNQFSLSTSSTNEKDQIKLKQNSESKSKEVKLPSLVKSTSRNEEEKEINRPEKLIGDNYLKEQKIATVRKKYSQQLDVLLSMVKSEHIDLSGLVVNPSSRPSSSSSTSSTSSFLPKIRSISQHSQSNQLENDNLDSINSITTSIYQITPINSINPNRKIVMSEVRNVIDELCSSSSFDSNSNFQKSSKNEIERLLLSLKDETNELSELRSQSKSQHQNNHHYDEKYETNENNKSVGKSYGIKIKEYYEKKKLDEDKENEERMMKENERSDAKSSVSFEANVKDCGSLSRMSTLELKQSNQSKSNHNHKKSKEKSKKKFEEDKSIGTTKEINQQSQDQEYKEMKKSSNLIVEFESNFESLQNKMNTMLSRANQVTSNEYEDESDMKMRRLLEEIYSIDFNVDQSNYIDEKEIENEVEFERDDNIEDYKNYETKGCF